MIGHVSVDVTMGDGQEFKLMIPDLQKDLNVLIGQNGVGKTLFMIWTWYCGFMLQMYKVTLFTHPNNVDAEFKQMADRVLAMTFDKAEGISGIISFKDHDDDHYSMKMYFTEGELDRFIIEMQDKEKFKITQAAPVKYNSKDARLFSSYEKYLNLLEMVDIVQPTSLTDFEKLNKMFKIFDVLWFEGIRMKCLDWIQNGIPTDINQRIVDFHKNWPSENDAFGPNPHLVFIDGMPSIKSDTIEKKFSEFGSGHQAVLMTYIFI